jgi:hypothetical protein
VRTPIEAAGFNWRLIVRLPEVASRSMVTADMRRLFLEVALRRQRVIRRIASIETLQSAASKLCEHNVLALTGSRKFINYLDLNRSIRNASANPEQRFSPRRCAKLAARGKCMVGRGGHRAQ